MRTFVRISLYFALSFAVVLGGQLLAEKRETKNWYECQNRFDKRKDPLIKLRDDRKITERDYSQRLESLYREFNPDNPFEPCPHHSHVDPFWGGINTVLLFSLLGFADFSVGILRDTKGNTKKS